MAGQGASVGRIQQPKLVANRELAEADKVGLLPPLSPRLRQLRYLDGTRLVASLTGDRHNPDAKWNNQAAVIAQSFRSRWNSSQDSSNSRLSWLIRP